MSPQISTKAIILSRVNYGEYDRILTILTKDEGKQSVIAKGVRKINSKLAGSLELFCELDIVYIKSSKGLSIITSSRIAASYMDIAKDLDRSVLGFKLLKFINSNLHDSSDNGYFEVLDHALDALNRNSIDKSLVETWFYAKILSLSGHRPSLDLDELGQKLDRGALYNFNFDQMCFMKNDKGRFEEKDIKFLRLLFSKISLKSLASIKDYKDLNRNVAIVISTMINDLL